MSRMPWGIKTGHKAKYPSAFDAPKKNKFSARRTLAHGIWFASGMEAKRYGQLLMMVTAGAISNLKLKPKFLLQEAFTEADGTKHRKMEYEADFRYDENGLDVVEDVKGFRNRIFLNKWKLFRQLYPKLTGRLT